MRIDSRMANDTLCATHSRESYEHTRPNQGYRLVEPPVRDSLLAISSVYDKEKIIVVGGTGVSLHCYKKMLYHKTRKTGDVDIKYKDRLTKSTFRNGIGREISAALSRYGYRPTIHPHMHNNFSVVVIRQDDLSDAFYVTTSRMSEKYWEARRQISEKEFKGADQVEIPDSKERVNVACIEDLIAPKMLNRRVQDEYDIETATKYGPKIEQKRLEEMLYLWSGGSQEKVERCMADFRKLKDRIF